MTIERTREVQLSNSSPPPEDHSDGFEYATRSGQDIAANLGDDFEVVTKTVTDELPPVDPPAETPPPADEDEPDDEPEPVTPHKRPGSRERKITKLTETLTSKEAELQAERDALALERETLKTEREERAKLAAELEELKKTPAPVVAPVVVPETPAKPAVVAEPEPVIPEAKPRPKRPLMAEFFESDDPDAALAAATEKYEDDLLEWRDQEKERKSLTDGAAKKKSDAEAKAASEAKTATEREQTETTARIERWKTQAAEAKAAHPDFEEVLGKAQPFTGPMLTGIHAMDKTAEIGYYLCNRPEELDRLVKATKLPENPTQSAVDRVMRFVYKEYERIESELATPAPAPETPPAAETAPVTPVAVEAPVVPQAVRKHDPVVPVGSRGGRVVKTLRELEVSKDPEDIEYIRNMPMDEYRRLSGQM